MKLRGATRATLEPARRDRPAAPGSQFLSRRVRLARKYVAPLLARPSGRRWGNLLRAEWHRARGDALVSSLPPVVLVDPTNACNLACPLCPTGQRLQSRPTGFMTQELYRRTVDEIAPWSYKIVLHNWGEPLLHPDIAGMIAYASGKGLATELSSNLNALSDELASELVRAGLGRLVVSVDGATQDSYSAYRRGGSLEGVRENIARIADTRRRLRSTLPEIEVQTLAMRTNEHELGSFEEEARRWGADRWQPGFVIVNTLDPRQVEEWLPSDPARSRYDPASLADRLLRPGRRCSWLWRSMTVNWDGTVAPCCNFDRREAEFGDLGAMGVRELWNNAQYVEARRLFDDPGRLLPRPGAPRDGEIICSWCAGLPRARLDTDQGVY